jgi:hypothetical protein
MSSILATRSAKRWAPAARACAKILCLASADPVKQGQRVGYLAEKIAIGPRRQGALPRSSRRWS